MAVSSPLDEPLEQQRAYAMMAGMTLDEWRAEIQADIDALEQEKRDLASGRKKYSDQKLSGEFHFKVL